MGTTGGKHPQAGGTGSAGGTDRGRSPSQGSAGTKSSTGTKSSPGAQGPDASGKQDGGSAAGGRGVSRRALLVGGGGLGAAVAAGLAHEELARLWWRLPGVDKSRRPGEVDVAGAQWTGASPSNWRQADRPADYAIDRVVVHITQSSFRSAVRAFQEPAHEAAAHYVVRRDGYIMQMVRELDIAFHAGNWEYNVRSIGIEHEGHVTDSTFPDAMYRASARLTAGICARYGFPADREHIVGHVEVPGTDHTDPGPHWAWDAYMDLVAAAAP